MFQLKSEKLVIAMNVVFAVGSGIAAVVYGKDAFQGIMMRKAG